jgi:hypothetical protein
MRLAQPIGKGDRRRLHPEGRLNRVELFARGSTVELLNLNCSLMKMKYA